MASWTVRMTVAFSVGGPDDPVNVAVFTAESVAYDQVSLDDVETVTAEPVAFVAGQLVPTGEPVDITAAYTSALGAVREREGL